MNDTNVLDVVASEPIPNTGPVEARKVWKKMMRIHFTKRLPTVKECGHKFNPESDPRNNCKSCWFAYFQNNGQMTQIADECFTEAGRDVLERSRGKKFVKYFLMFMSTIARFQREEAARVAASAAKEKVDGEENTDRGGDTTIGDSGSNTSIGGLAGDPQTIGGLQSDTGCEINYVAETEVDEGTIA